MKHITKLVARALVLFIVVTPMFGSEHCSNAALSGACCKPDCPMMAASPVANAASSGEGRLSVANRCIATQSSPMSFAIRQRVTKPPISKAQSEIVTDLPRARMLAGKAYVIFRSEGALRQPRSALCVFLI